MNALQTLLVKELANRFPGTTEFRRADIERTAQELGVKYSNKNAVYAMATKPRKGIYDLSAVILPLREEQVEQPKMTAAIHSTSNDEVYVPSVDKTFVKWGFYKDVETIINSRMFYPTYVMGLSGNGKTFMIEQACARTGREYVRVQITPETDEDDLIGGFRLVNGETVFFEGPVIKAMRAGAILLIDEIDRASNKLMCLQGIMEGKPVLLKKTGDVIQAKDGFNIIATANTKGKGSDDGRFTAATIIDDAFLERFVITMEQQFPSSRIEKNIIVNHMNKFNCVDNEFADKLVMWADVIRKTFDEEGVEEVISTRRLCHIVQTFSIFSDRMKAIELCVSRFADDDKLAFMDLYMKVDADASQFQQESEAPVEESTSNGDEVPF